MRDYGILTWDPHPMETLIVHWKDDLPFLLIAVFWFAVLACYFACKDRQTKDPSGIKPLPPIRPGSFHEPR